MVKVKDLKFIGIFPHLGCRSKIGSGKVKFNGQFLASIQQNWRFLQFPKVTKLAKVAHARGSKGMPPRKVMNFGSSEMAFSPILG